MTDNNNPAGSGYGVPRPFTFDRVVRILFSIAALLAAVWLIDILKSVLLPFLIAWLVAYLLEPFVQYNKRLPRAVSFTHLTLPTKRVAGGSGGGGRVNKET